MLHVTSWRKLKVFKWRMGGTQYCSEQCIKSPSKYSTWFIKFRVVVTSLLIVTKASSLARDKYQGMFKIQLPRFANCLGAEQVPKPLHSLLARGCSFQSRRRGELCQSSDPCVGADDTLKRRTSSRWSVPFAPGSGMGVVRAIMQRGCCQTPRFRRPWWELCGCVTLRMELGPVCRSFRQSAIGECQAGPKTVATL